MSLLVMCIMSIGLIGCDGEANPNERSERMKLEIGNVIKESREDPFKFSILVKTDLHKTLA